MRAPELHPLLQGTPSLATRKTRALHQLANDLNLIRELIERLGTCAALRPCDQYSPDPYQPDEHVRAVEAGNYKRALQLLTLYGISS